MRGVRASDYSQNTLGVNFNKKESGEKNNIFLTLSLFIDNIYNYV